MGADDIPSSGISLDGQIYIIASTGVTMAMKSNGTSYHYHGTDYSVLTKFDPSTQTFAAGRTISKVNAGGHFVYLALHEFPLISGLSFPGFNEDMVAMFGVGFYRQSNIYLALVPKNGFDSGAGTLYFTGLDRFGLPTWGSKDDSTDVPVVTDLDPANPSIGNLSVTYSPELNLWLMTFDGGRTPDPDDPDSPGTAGIYFTYAAQPWGPWAKPQQIWNNCQDGGYGNFIFYYAKSPAADGCPAAVDDTTLFPASSGPAGPTIGPQQDPGNPPLTTRGGGFAPQMIERFTEIEGNTLKIYYTLST